YPTSSGVTVCEGGGIWSGTNLTLQSCLVRANLTDANSAQNIGLPASATSRGGGVFSKGSSFQRNSIVTENIVTGEVGTLSSSPIIKLNGGGVYCSGGSSISENCAIAFNNPDGLATDTNATKVLNSILWGNVTNKIVGTTNVTYSDVQGGMAGAGNKSGNP